MDRRLLIAIGGMLIAACAKAPIDAAAVVDEASAAPAASLDGSFTIERSPCFGPCPSYEASVFGNDKLVFNGFKFTTVEGVKEKQLPKGSFVRLVEIAYARHFASIDPEWPDAENKNCDEPPTDAAFLVITVSAPDIQHSVRFYEGCASYSGGDNIMELAKEAEGVMAISDWIGPRSDWMGGRKP
jgi:hypothetical protein